MVEEIDWDLGEARHRRADMFENIHFNSIVTYLINQDIWILDRDAPAGEFSQELFDNIKHSFGYRDDSLQELRFGADEKSIVENFFLKGTVIVQDAHRFDKIKLDVTGYCGTKISYYKSVVSDIQDVVDVLKVCNKQYLGVAYGRTKAAFFIY